MVDAAPILMRMVGLTGMPMTRRGRDYSGAEVHSAARFAGAAQGGEILVTTAALAEVGDGFVVSESREVTLKGVDDLVGVATVDWR